MFKFRNPFAKTYTEQELKAARDEIAYLEHEGQIMLSGAFGKAGGYPWQLNYAVKLRRKYNIVD